jgi:hypothetical protein
MYSHNLTKPKVSKPNLDKPELTKPNLPYQIIYRTVQYNIYYQTQLNKNSISRDFKFKQ